ncbi:DedA family protein [Mesorhizobium microcysteis]|uniref:DedA family protein n=1 Tax=Neoaquamicrobium microcysteis TaxID=2682781 RepID=A0A5D4GZA4_9HYPH|nr:DedA family protein [Mesorhizobium microcysteis]TYR33718.1 DedA family protein [Mesorhizobium microcysteis]
MTDAIHLLIERYGLIAVFLGCVAEGESAAVLAGFFAHQHVFNAAGAFLAVFGGAFLGDALFFMAGRRFAAHPFVVRQAARPGFSRALELVAKRPATYVMLNRYAYGFRLVGGVAAGLSSIPAGKFVALNAVSSAVWAVLFLGAGYLLGAGAEQLVGQELARHERLLIGLGIGLVTTLLAAVAAHHYARRAKG